MRWIVSLILGIIIAGILSGLFIFFARPLLREAREYLRYGYTLPQNVERRLATIDGEEVSFLVFHDVDAIKWDFANAPSSPRSVHEWRNVLSADVVINGSYFNEVNQPTGYYSIDGNANMVCPMFSSDYDTAFGYTFAVWIDNDQLEFGYASDVPFLCGGPESLPVTAFVSFPTLIYNNASMIETNSGLKARRTFLAETVEGQKEIIVTESGEVTLFDAAQWFLDQHEEYSVVGNLDGGPSTGLSIAQDRWSVEVPSSAVPNVIFGKPYSEL
ncbi:MAG: phosphodiester glycosidase family protein [Patescibacteria group bacterium]|jgi:hypothetical protein